MKRPPQRLSRRTPPPPSTLRRAVRWGLLALVGWYVACLLGLVLLRWIPPVTSAVQIERRVESWIDRSPYVKRYRWVPMNRISRDLQRAAVAAEDTAFYQHHGIDWAEVSKVLEQSSRRGELTRGGSTISQQLVKNLFLTTKGSIFRKAAEYALVFPAERILGKQRILELYLNIIEWGPGVFGAEAAAQYHYKTSAANLNLQQAARLAGVIPAPRTRRPSRMDSYSAEIVNRIARLGL